MYINYRFIMASSTLALSSPPHWTKFELSGFFSNKSRSRFDFRRIQNVGVSSHYSCLEVKDVCYRPPGTQLNILNEVSFSLLEKSFGLIFGQSGSGKTTLLQLLAGLSKPTSGSFYFKNMGMMANQMVLLSRYSLKEWALCFSFQRSIKTNWTLYFLADNVLDEIIFGWPRQSSDPQLKKYLALNLVRAINWVGLGGISLNKDPHSLSGGYKHRLALAIQLVQIPDLLILDEPLAGLDWKAQADVVKLLKHLKKELTILVVSHDLKELATLVDQSWRMDMGGTQREEPLPL